MNASKWIATSLVAAALAAPRLAHAEPAWCKVDGTRSLENHNTLDDVQKAKDPRDAIYALVAMACDTDGPPQAPDPQVMAALADWSHRLYMDDADWKDAAESAHAPASDIGSATLRMKDQRIAWSTYTPVDQYARFTTLSMAGGNRGADPRTWRMRSVPGSPRPAASRTSSCAWRATIRSRGRCVRATSTRSIRRSSPASSGPTRHTPDSSAC